MLPSGPPGRKSQLGRGISGREKRKGKGKGKEKKRTDLPTYLPTNTDADDVHD